MDGGKNEGSMKRSQQGSKGKEGDRKSRTSTSFGKPGVLG